MRIQIYSFFLILIIIIFPLFDIIGIFNNYSPVPYWDMWNGNYLFYLSAKNGEIGSWFAQHNEHRIIFSRVLFYLDNYFFNGNSIFLLTMNFALLACIYYIYHCILNKFDLRKKYLIFLKIIIISLIFSWVQKENLNWGFQSQFYISYLFPLLSFYFVVDYFENKKIFSIILTFLFSILSIGTMGNGIMVFPLLFLLFFILKLDKKFYYILLIICSILLSLHFIFYKTPEHHSSSIINLISNPLKSFVFFSGIIGSPLYSIYKNQFLAIFFGIIFLILYLISLFKYKIFADKNKIYLLPLYLIILYFIISAIAISGSRSQAGLEAAFASRYTTASLIGWSSLLTLLIVLFLNQKYIRYFILLSLFFLFSLIPYQFKVHKNNYQNIYEMNISILALSLSVKDVLFLQKVYPIADHLEVISKPIKNAKLSVFSQPLFNNLSRIIGSRVVVKNPLIVDGFIDRFENIDNNSDYLRVLGWLQSSSNLYPQKILILNESFEVVGVALMGSTREDLLPIFGPNSLKWGFYGYLKKSYYNHLYLFNYDNNELRKIK